MQFLTESNRKWWILIGVSIACLSCEQEAILAKTKCFEVLREHLQK